MKNNKRWLSLLLVFVMMLSVMPLNVFAVEANTEVPKNETATTDKAKEDTSIRQKRAGVVDLASKISEAKIKATQTDIYTAASIAKLNTEIGKAELVPNDGTATAEQINTAFSDLQLAIDGLVLINPVNKVELVTKISEAETKAGQTTIYTADSIAKLNTEITKAKAVNIKPDASQTEVDASIVLLDKAIKELVVIPTTKFTVKYNNNGATSGTAPTDSTEYTSGQSAIVLGKGDLVKTNNTFSGWNTESNGTGTTYQEGTKITMNANVNLYAQWTPNATTGTLPTIPTRSYDFDKRYDGNVTIPVTMGTGSYLSDGIYSVSGEGISVNDYSLNAAKNVLTINSSFLKTLTTGAKTFTVTFNNSVKTPINVSITVKDTSTTSLYVEDAYRSGDYIKGRVSRGNATVYFYRDSYSGYYKSTTADSNGYFSIYIGSISTTSNDYVIAKYGSDTSARKYVGSSSGEWGSNNNYDRQIYPTRISVSSDGYRVSGETNYKNTKIYVYYDGREVGSGYTDSTGYFNISTNSRVSNNSYLKFYTNNSTSTSNQKQVYPSSISLSSDNYKVTGYLRDYKNTKVYVYYDGKEVGSGYTNSSDGYFSISTSRKIYNDSYLKFYVASSSDKTKAASITSAKAGEYKIEGTAAAYATVTVKDKDNVKLGSATADKDGKFTIYANRTLKSGEKLTITTSESGKSDNTTTYTVSESKTADLKRISYIKGYPNGNFKPHGNITRGEAATMFARLLNNSDNFGTTKTTKFTDANNQWYSEAINYVVNKGLISGYPDGTFKPNANITRAEFAQMISGYVTVGGNATNFKDVNDHWAKEAIEKLYGNKSVTGYPDGTFKPNDEITRAEAVTILNSVFGRVSNTQSFDSVKSSLKSFGDVKSSDWFYANVMDASNAHDSYRKSSTDDTEVWTKIN